MGQKVHYSIGWDPDARERAAIGRAPGTPGPPSSTAAAKPRGLDEAGVVELTALVLQGPDGDQRVGPGWWLAQSNASACPRSWPMSMKR